MHDTEAQVVGVEKMETDPSQVPFMRSHDIASVDDLDLPRGQDRARVGAARARMGGTGASPPPNDSLPPPPERAATRR